MLIGIDCLLGSKPSRIEFESFSPRSIIKGDEMGKKFVTQQQRQLSASAALSLSSLNVSYALNNKFSPRLIFKSHAIVRAFSSVARKWNANCELSRSAPLVNYRLASLIECLFIRLRLPHVRTRALVTDSGKHYVWRQFRGNDNSVRLKALIKNFFVVSALSFFSGLCVNPPMLWATFLLCLKFLKRKAFFQQGFSTNILWQPPPTAKGVRNECRD